MENGKQLYQLEYSAYVHFLLLLVSQITPFPSIPFSEVVAEICISSLDSLTF